MPFSELDWLRRVIDRTCREGTGAAEPPALPRYEVRDRLGEGATAVVYRAWDRELKRLVALKVLRDAGAMGEVARERFRREAQAAAGLVHPNVVTLYDAGEEEGRLYLVMELVDGRPLEEALTERGRDGRKVVELVEKIARGVAAAHEKGIVHRDLKPGNILVTAAGEPKVGDFGLAQLEDADARLTRTGTPMGTPLYMSPEQARGGKDLTARTDVYALGVILYEGLSGRPPHRGETALEIYGKVVNEDPVPLRRMNPGVPLELETIVSRALEKRADQRYANAGELADELRRFLNGEPIRARPLSWPERLWRKAAKRWAVVVPTAAAVLLAAAWAVRALAGGGEPAAPPVVAKPPAVEGPPLGDVQFREDFERYDDKRWVEHATKPDSIKIAAGGVNGGKCLELTVRPGGPETAPHLYKVLPAGLDTCYVRFYLRVERMPEEILAEVQLIGDNPSSRWYQPPPTEPPAGDRRLMTIVGPRDSKRGKGTPRIWRLTTHSFEVSSGRDKSYKPAAFSPPTPVPVDWDRWTCVELMLRCNSAPEKADGEQALWIDGKEVGRWGKLRWRTSPALKANALCLTVQYGPVVGSKEELASRVSRVCFDEVVVSKAYVGPVAR